MALPSSAARLLTKLNDAGYQVGQTVAESGVQFSADHPRQPIQLLITWVMKPGTDRFSFSSCYLIPPTGQSKKMKSREMIAFIEGTGPAQS